MDNKLELVYILVSAVMICSGIISCMCDELTKTVMFIGIGIWDVLVAVLVKEG